MFWWFLLHLLTLEKVVSSVAPHSSVTYGRKALAATLLSSFPHGRVAPASQRIGRSTMTVRVPQRRDIKRQVVPVSDEAKRKLVENKLNEIDLTPIARQPRQSTYSSPVLEKKENLALFSQTDQPLLFTTAATVVALSIAWLSASGGEYWTAASRAADVAMLRTMFADYATQLGRHKLSHRDGKSSDGNAIDEFQPNWNRTFSMGLFYALYYIGPFSYVLTELYPRWFGNDGSWQEVMTKVFVENIFWMPIGYWVLWSMFKVVIDGYLERGQHSEDAIGETGNPFENLVNAVWRDITTDFRKKNLASLTFWGPADIFNFKFVPQYDVPTAMVFEGAIWAAILGTIEYDQKNKTAVDS